METLDEQLAATEPLAILRALSDPVRLAIINELRGGPLCGRDLRERLAVSSPLLSHHLRVLQRAELVNCERVGRCLEVTLNHEGFDRLEAVLPRRNEARTEGIGAR